MPSVEKVRKRKSYKMFLELHRFLESQPSEAEILNKIYEILDDKRAFGSRTHSIYAEESLKQLISDFNIQ